ncbi:hypothetical protein PS15p_206348 [Mucor circinelloides]
MLNRLPYEIVLLILVRLNNRKDLFSILGSCRSLYGLIQDDSFWRDLVRRRYGIKYNIQQQSWWQLYISGDASQMCCHLQNYDVRSLQIKRDLLWNSIQNLNGVCCRNVQFDQYGLCMESQCEFIGCGDVFFEKDESYSGHLREHHQQTQHNIVLKLSPLNFMELWCYSCNSPIGHWGFPRIEKPIAEKYMCRDILQFMTALPPDYNPLLRLDVIERRRLIEQRLSVFQQNHDFTYLIEKRWFTKWINFLIGRSNEMPGALDNSILFFPHDKRKLRHDLIIGCDYELVGQSIRAYIERVYGLENESCIVSGGQPLYRGISQSALLHRHYH